MEAANRPTEPFVTLLAPILAPLDIHRVTGSLVAEPLRVPRIRHSPLHRRAIVPEPSGLATSVVHHREHGALAIEGDATVACAVRARMVEAEALCLRHSPIPFLRQRRRGGVT